LGQAVDLGGSSLLEGLTNRGKGGVHVLRHLEEVLREVNFLFHSREKKRKK